MSFEKELPIMFSVKVFEWLKCFCLNKQNFTFMLPCIVIDFFLSNQTDALMIPVLSCYKTLHVSGILSAHHQEFSTVHSALVGFM